MKLRLLPLLTMTFVMFIAGAAQAQRTTVRCESSNNHYRECTFNGFGSVAIGRQLSSVACQEGRSWGVKNDNTIWVNNGCRADFYVMQPSEAHRPPARHAATGTAVETGTVTAVAARTVSTRTIAASIVATCAGPCAAAR